MKHLFALTLPPDVQPFVAETIEYWRRLLPINVAARWCAPDDCHLTLKFLGDVPETRQAQLTQAAAAITADSTPFPVSLAPCGGFPNLQRPFVLWMGVADSLQLTELAEQVDRAVTPLGFAPERRPYVPHITLARCRAGRQAATLPTPEDGERTFPCFQVTQFALMQTSLPEARPKDSKRRYNIVHTFPLGNTHLSASH